jgi:hypothetical protein
MARTIVVATGYTGYRHQLDRARRFLNRIEGTHANEIDFQDMVWAFFQNCWHVKDWVEHDPKVSRPVKDAVEDQARRSWALKICRELCNGTKHLGARHGARHQHVEMDFDSSSKAAMDCVIDDGRGSDISGKELARTCIAEWERILKSHRLATPRSS